MIIAFPALGKNRSLHMCVTYGYTHPHVLHNVSHISLRLMEYVKEDMAPFHPR